MLTETVMTVKGVVNVSNVTALPNVKTVQAMVIVRSAITVTESVLYAAEKDM